MGLLVFALIRKFIGPPRHCLEQNCMGDEGGGGGVGGESEYKSDTTGKLQPKATWDSLQVSLQMLSTRSVIRYCTL